MQCWLFKGTLKQSHYYSICMENKRVANSTTDFTPTRANKVSPSVQPIQQLDGLGIVGAASEGPADGIASYKSPVNVQYEVILGLVIKMGISWLYVSMGRWQNNISCLGANVEK